MHKWNIYKDLDEASKFAADFIASNINKSIQQRDICYVILSGGNTPAHCLNILAGKPIAWSKVHWYLADERCYPSGHAERNDLMLKKNLWSIISETNIHVIPSELGAEEAARVYRDIIKDIEYFDIAFLGVGEDGHTASLFPDNKALLDTRSVVPVYDSPKPPSDRVSLSFNTLKQSHCKLVLASGADKAPIISRIKAGELLPINTLGDINWYVDEATQTI